MLHSYCKVARKRYIGNIFTQAPKSQMTMTHPGKVETFEAQLRTRQVLDDNRDSFAETISHLRKRLQSVVQNDGPDNELERLRLQLNINTSKQCLDVCKLAGEISHQAKHISSSGASSPKKLLAQGTRPVQYPSQFRVFKTAFHSMVYWIHSNVGTVDYVEVCVCELQKFPCRLDV